VMLGWDGAGQLSPETAQLYELLLRLHVAPTFGEMSISDIRQEHVRAWRAAELKTGPQQHPPFGPVTVAKAYLLLRAILSTAVTDSGSERIPVRSRARRGRARWISHLSCGFGVWSG
jgi:Phage integrase, N-terminal SAM-like domain